MISAIVINWNGEGYLRRCLESLLAQEPPPDEVLVVDNASTDRSVAIARTFPGVEVLDTGANRGPAAARNLGVERARHERCLLLDNDVVLEPGAIAALNEVLEAHPGAGMVQARSLCGDRPDVVHYDGAELHFLGTLVLHNWFRPLDRAAEVPDPAGAGVALCFLTRRSVYREVGGFEEELFILYEDNEFSYKLRMRGHTIHLAPRARVVHLAGTAGLSVRGEDDAYPGRRTYLHARNRWYLLLTCMRLRTLVLTLPAQLAYGVVYAAFGHGRGHVRDWWRAKWELFRMLPAALRRRSRVQQGRTVPDRELLVARPLTLNPGLADRGFRAFVRRTMNAFFVGYWRVVRRFCG